MFIYSCNFDFETWTRLYTVNVFHCSFKSVTAFRLESSCRQILQQFTAQAVCMNVPWTFVTVRPFLKTLNYRLWPFNLTFINVFGLKTVSKVGLSETFRCYMMNDPKCLQNHVHGMFIDHWLKTLFTNSFYLIKRVCIKKEFISFE